MIIGDLDVTEWLRGTRQQEWAPGAGQLLVVGDDEIQYVIEEVAGVARVGVNDRSSTPRGIASCSDVETAARIVVILLGSDWRSARRFGRLTAAASPDATVEPTPLGIHAEWPGGWADLRRRDTTLTALLTRAARAPLSVVAASTRDPHGAPLFSEAPAASR